MVAKGTNFKNEPEDFNVELEQGTHQLTIKYFNKHIQNQLNILYRVSGQKDFDPFENLVRLVE
jgi:hypothetical protein